MKNASDDVFHWFVSKQLKANFKKPHLIITYYNEMSNQGVIISVNNYNIANSKCEKLLTIKSDHKLSFNTHIDEICKKARQKLNALSRLTP